MNVLVGFLAAIICVSYMNRIQELIVKPVLDPTHEILKPYPEEPKKAQSKPTDPRKEAFLETCPKYGFTPKKCEYIWTHEDDQTALTLPTKGVKIEATETPLIEDKE